MIGLGNAMVSSSREAPVVISDFHTVVIESLPKRLNNVPGTRAPSTIR